MGLTVADIVYDGVLDGDREGVTDGLGVFDRVTEGLSDEVYEPDAEMKRRKGKKTMIRPSRAKSTTLKPRKLTRKMRKERDLWQRCWKGIND